MKKSWVTTLIGWASAALYIGSKLVKTGAVTTEDFIVAGAMAGIGTASKDYNATGK